MTQRPNNYTVNRSRIKLLGALAMAGASGGCATSDPDAPKRKVTAQEKLDNYDPLSGLKTALTRTGPTKAEIAREKARKKAQEEALARKKAEYTRKRDKALKKIKKYGNPDEVYIPKADDWADDYFRDKPDPMGGEGGGGGSH